LPPPAFEHEGLLPSPQWLKDQLFTAPKPRPIRFSGRGAVVYDLVNGLLHTDVCCSKQLEEFRRFGGAEA